FTTVLTRVESCLNSRPIAPLSPDPHDLQPLSPAHFLIGRNLLAPPEPPVGSMNPSSRWKLVTKLTQDIWKRWARDYLTTLQQRQKWRTGGQDIKVGDLVLIKEDSVPTQWPIARVTDVHPGKDGVVRVVTLKTKGNTIRQRPVVKVCKLPIETNEDSKDNTAVASSLQKPKEDEIGSDDQEEKDNTTRRPRRHLPVLRGGSLSVMLSLLFLLTMGWNMLVIKV
uniref:Uncharacterized protein n=1 Tax=Phlebotomus papatasi TaxID=29031 RepID=A0A1B0GPR9_PHLPP